MSSEARQLLDIQRRLDHLEALTQIIYETGSITPTLAGSTVAGVTTYVSQTGQYTRLGNRVDFSLTLQWSAATGTGNPRIGGLPYASVAGQNFAPSIWHSTVTFANGSVAVLLSPSLTTMRLFSPLTNAGATELVMEAAGLIVVSGTYFVA